MARRIRILFVITQFETGGVQFQLWLRLKHLDRARVEPRVVVLTGGESFLLDRIRGLGIPVEMLGIDRERALWRRVAKLRHFIAAARPDVVDTMLMWDNVYGAVAAALEGVPLIVAELQNNRESVRRGYGWVFRRLEAFALRRLADHVVACSQAVFDDYAREFRWFARKASVIHDAIDTHHPRADRDAARVMLGLPLDRPVVATIGRLAEQKDHATLIRAAARVMAVDPRVVLAIAGYGPLREALQAQCEAAGIADRVRFLGEITDPYAVYAAADVFVMTSRWEGFPVVLLEAMATGCAVVSTKVGGIGEAITDRRSGWLCAPPDDRAIAHAVSRLVADPVLRANMGVAAEADVARYDIGELGPRWQRIYRQVEARLGPVEPMVVPVIRAADEEGGARLPVEARRILVWRLAPLDRVIALVRRVQARYPNARIDCACQYSVAERMAAATTATPVVYGDGPLTPSRIGASTLLSLRTAHYDLVVLPLNHPSREGYGWAQVCALWAGRGRLILAKGWTDEPRLGDEVTWGSFLTMVLGRVGDGVRSLALLVRTGATGWRRVRLMEGPR